MSDYEPKIVAFTCNWCSYAAADLAGTSRLAYPANIRIIRVMCTGMVDPIYVLRSFELGMDGVMIAGCHIGDCHYISGNVRAEERVGKLRQLIHTLGLEDERLLLKWCATSEGVQFAAAVTGFTKTLQQLGPSPFRMAKEAAV